jgi:hypothetical protein
MHHLMSVPLCLVEEKVVNFRCVAWWRHCVPANTQRFRMLVEKSATMAACHALDAYRGA